MSGLPDLAATRYRQLSERFGGRSNDAGLPYALLADIGLAEVSTLADASLVLLRNILSPRYNAPNALLEVVASQAIERLGIATLTVAQKTELAGMRQSLQSLAASTLLAKRLSTRGQELASAASDVAQSFVAPWQSQTSLIYKRSGDGKIYGVVRTEADLQERAAMVASQLGLDFSLRARVVNLQVADEVRPPERRAQISLGPLWPHLSLVLMQTGSGSSGMGDIAEARRRHRGITGGLVAVLVLGLLATIRGVARERELARLKSDFVSTVSHELKTPLTSIRMFAEMLQQGVAGEDREREAHYQGIIVKESERLGLLIANLLDYSQIERGSRKYTDEKQLAVAIVREASQTFARFREGEGQELVEVVDANAEDCSIHVDRNVMVQCVLNLLSNAAKYGGDGAIELRLQRDAKTGVVALSVRDHGPGISTSEQERIFREFYRAPEAIKSAIEGTGLGLALVKRHVEAQGGSVNVHSIPGQGATFTIRLPEAS